VPAGNVAESDSVADTTATDTTATDTTGTDTTIVRRGTLTVTALSSSGDAALVARLGWTGGIIAGASVQARLGATTLTGTTDGTGSVSFPDILPGLYQVSALRVLSDAERALLGPEDAAISAFGGGDALILTSPRTEGTITLQATRRGSLVNSEKFSSTRVNAAELYRFGTYVEIHNNSDTTIFLDGKLFGNGPFFVRDAPELGLPCSLTQQWQTDPDGLWTPLLYRLPGTGQQYPLAPGETAVLAADAVDHSVVDPRWPDLSSARFEFLGPADVDNPAAANILPAGTPAWDDILGHGPQFSANQIYFIADPVDLATLPMVQPPNYRVPIPRIPREKILDVMYLLYPTSYWEQYGWTLCPVLINPVFDAGPAMILTPGAFESAERRRIGPILQRSRSTVNDFEILSAPTPGYVR
jgi:hypothetical protein